jgi:hypothetical protein
LEHIEQVKPLACKEALENWAEEWSPVNAIRSNDSMIFKII